MGCVLNHWAALCLDSQVNTMIYIYLSDTERSRKGFICHVFPEDFLFFFLKQHILISQYSVTSAVTTTSISPVIKWQFCLQASRFSWCLSLPSPVFLRGSQFSWISLTSLPTFWSFIMICFWPSAACRLRTEKWRIRKRGIFHFLPKVFN